MSETHLSHSPRQTMDLAQQLALQLKKGDVVALTGDLGTGKTIFAKGLIMALGYKSHISSPTYTIQQTYRTPSLTIHHIDLYRLATEDDVDMLDLEACWQNEAITVIEWADRANPQQLPHNTWHVDVRSTSEEEVRIIQVCPPNDARIKTRKTYGRKIRLDLPKVAGASSSR